MTEDYVTSVLAIGSAVGIAVAWCSTAPAAGGAALGVLQRTLEQVLVRRALRRDLLQAAVFVTTLLRRGVEEPLIGGSITGVTVGAREAGDALGEVQTGYLRSYALAIAGAVAILVVVFITVQ